MKWWNRLSYRLTIFILFLAVLPLAGFGISTITDIHHARLQSIEQIHRSIAKSSVDLIELSLADTIKKIQLVIDSNELEDLDGSDQEWFLQMLIKAIPHLYTLTIVDNNGLERVKVGRDTVYNPKDLELRTDHPDFLKNKELTPTIGQVREHLNNILMLDLYIPLLSPMDRKVNAVLAVEIDIEKLLNFTADLRVGKTGYVCVVDNKGKILVHPDHSVVLAGEDALKNPLVKEFVSRQKVTGENQIYTNHQQIEVLTNVRAVKELNLLVVVVQSVKEALATVTQVRIRQALTLVVVLVVAIFLSLYFIVKLNRPLGRLASGAQRIGTGDLNHRIKVTSSDELGIVTQSFNAMAEDLETSRKTADQQNWVRQGVGELDRLLRGDLSLEQVCTNVITFMADYLKEQVGLIYVHDGKGRYQYKAGYAFQPGEGFSKSF